MAWGGSLNKEGSDHIRKLKEADNVVRFLEKFKENLAKEQKETVSRVIELIVNHFTQKK
jgi:hypothetical protein